MKDIYLTRLRHCFCSRVFIGLFVSNIRWKTVVDIVTKLSE